MDIFELNKNLFVNAIIELYKINKKNLHIDYTIK